MNIYRSKKELDEQTIELKKEALKEINYANREMRKENKKKIIKWIFILILLIVLIKLFFGTINIPSPFLYTKNRLYVVTVNDITSTIGIVETKTVPLIPYLINFKSHYSTFFNGEKEWSHFSINEGEKTILDIKSYNCFTTLKNTKKQLGCQDQGENSIEELTNDTTYTLFIRKTKPNVKNLYKGKFINNITNYLNEKGTYIIQITGKYKNIESNIIFWIIVE